MLKFSTAYKQNGTLRKIPGSDRFVVQENFAWEIDFFNKDKGKIVVPAGFGTNFGSIPALFRPFFSPTRYISYVLHDYLYTQGSVIEYNEEHRQATRKEADLILAEALLVEGMSRVGIFFVYVTLRLFGHSHFKK